MWSTYDAYENELVAAYKKLPVWEHISSFDNALFINVLLQLGEIGTIFLDWLKTAEINVRSERCKRALRAIAQMEQPVGAPTHQEDRIADLRLIGVSDAVFCQSKPSDVTRDVVRSIFERVSDTHEDISILVTVRMFGEVLAGENFARLWPELERRFGLAEATSRFYWPHYIHDSKGDGSTGHVAVFNHALQEMLANAERLRLAKEAAHEAWLLRKQLIEQFR
ncbi:hypothetical protein HY620_02035 [Candidatus Uhrbacteria bacterium]|nr:hypothetical protein [Candidatus Uhrbacteria bacterium]